MGVKTEVELDSWDTHTHTHAQPVKWLRQIKKVSSYLSLSQPPLRVCESMCVCVFLLTPTGLS